MREKEPRRSHVSGALSSSILSIADVFSMQGQKTVKFPEKLLKVLEHKLQDIAMGKDSSCVARSLTPSANLSSELGS
jgi:hypothetical protein